MKQVFLIAWREYKQYVLSRGFLIFLVMFPVSLVAFSAAMGLVERNKPIRAFVVYDETGVYSDDIDREIERRYLFSAISGWDAYVTAGTPVEALDEIPAPFRPDTLDDARARAFESAGGFAAARDAAAPYLRDGMPSYTLPRPSFERLEIANVAPGATSLENAEEILRPFLLDERRVGRADGTAAPLFAAVLIPADFSAAP
ncbi:MAG: hypothetical protein AAFW68_06330, partial [Pseudomonadota bacterium]